MKNWVALLLLTSFIISCSAPKASILEKNSNEFLVSIDKKATSPMDIVDVQLSDGNNWMSGSFQYIDKDGSGDIILNSKGYSSFGLEVSSPQLTFKPNKAMISYRTEKDGLIKSILIEFNSKN
jgi:hypothetical protein|tara:strand:+ start:15734 stop:16102 length:369 start_codon:yes stop_codon:yes gene_type:complete